MIVILKPGVTEAQADVVRKEITQKGAAVQEIQGGDALMFGLAGNASGLSAESVLRYPFVERVVEVSEPYKLASRKFHPADTVVELPGGQKIGGGNLAVIAGPCSVESEEQILSIARDVKLAGAHFLRGGAFKPRSSPYAFQGLGLDGGSFENGPGKNGAARGVGDHVPRVLRRL